MTENEKTNLPNQDSQCSNCKGCQDTRCMLHKDNMIALCDIVLSITRGDDWKLNENNGIRNRSSS